MRQSLCRTHRLIAYEYIIVAKVHVSRHEDGIPAFNVAGRWVGPPVGRDILFYVFYFLSPSLPRVRASLVCQSFFLLLGQCVAASARFRVRRDPKLV
jgi:hypothetical protein